MKRLLLLFCCLFVSCKSPPPPMPTLGVTISEQMYRTVTCRLKDDQLVWCKDDAPKDFVVRAQKHSTVLYVSSQSNARSAHVYLEKYTTQEPNASLKEVAFFHTLYSEKGVEYKRLVTPPNECVFWLQKANGYYLITNITRE